MSYVLVGIILLLIAAGFLVFLVLTATRRSSPARAEDVPGIGTDQQTPFGDTSEHAGEQAGGRSDRGHDGRETGDGPSEPAPPGRFQRDPVGGEAEARPFTGPRDGA